MRIAGDRARQLGDAVQRGRYVAGYHQKRWSTWKVKGSMLIIAFKVSSLVINDDGAMPIWIISCLDILLGYFGISACFASLRMKNGYQVNNFQKVGTIRTLWYSHVHGKFCE